MIRSLLAFLGLVALARAQATEWSQCGGIGWTGATTCVAGTVCTYSNPYYSQCLPGSSSSTASKSSSTSTSKPSSTSTSSSPTATISITPNSPQTAPTTPPSKLTGQLPALGWNAWNAYGCSISDSLIYGAAQDFTTLGLKAAGYQYINIDDCWAMTSRSSTGQLVPDPTKFPNGIANLASRVHALGLKMGIYGDAGTTTCAGYPGGLGHESVDAATYASWGIDYLKYDNCAVPSAWTDAATPPGGNWYESNSAIRYRGMGAALAEQQNPIQFSLCIWGDAEVWTWGSLVGHSWRMTGDATATWSFIESAIVNNAKYLNSVGFGAHNDMDMMEIGNGNLTLQEQRTHFAAWIFMKSPILLGTNLGALSSTQLGIVTNPELIAFHQDGTHGAAAMPFVPKGQSTTSPPTFYVGQSVKGTHVFIVNVNNAATFSFDFASAGLTGASYTVTNMWTQTVIGTFSGSYSISVDTHDTAALLITAA